VGQESVSSALLYLVLQLMRIVKADLAEGSDGVSVSPSQYRILRRLLQGEATVSELAEWNAVTLPTATKILDVLVDRGWVERWRSKVDRRLVYVGLTDRGRAVQAELEQRATGSVGELLAQLGEEDLAAVSQGVAALNDILAQEERAQLAQQSSSPAED
jgi:DNA-binding MarR family transcriptional regulator